MPDFYPGRSRFVELYSAGGMTFVYAEMVADGLTPVATYARLGRGPYSFLLESVVGGEAWSSFSFVGVRPRKVFRARGSEIEILHCEGPKQRVTRRTESDPLSTLNSLLNEMPMAVPEGLPRFFGGAVGWLGYDAVRWFERLPSSAADELDLPDACFMLTETMLVFDNLRGTIKIVTSVVNDGQDPHFAYVEACNRIVDVLDRLQTPGGPPLAPLDLMPSEVANARAPRSTMSREQYEANVRRVQDYIRAGDAFQVVLSQRFDVPQQHVDPFDVYRILRMINPSPYMYHLEFPEAVVTGASPECMVRKEGHELRVRPIAGTRRRGHTPEEDRLLEVELKQDEKECAEHVMLIDLGRNDLGRVSVPGSVQLDETMTVERYSHVMHLVSGVSGILAEDKNVMDVIRATFPAGTLSGAPKIRAMEIIEELEPCRRGVYGGAVGYLSYTGNADLAIAIRTLVVRDDTIHVQAGAGIVADSVPTAEYQECLSKARAVLQAVEIARTHQERRRVYSDHRMDGKTSEKTVASFVPAE